MQRAIITLMGLYKEYPTLLDEFNLPERINKDDLIGRLITEAGELEVYITRPETMKSLVGFWSRGRLPSWSKIADMITYEYNPIWNVDGETVHEGEASQLNISSGSDSKTSTEAVTESGERTDTENNSYTRDRDVSDVLNNTHTDTTDHSSTDKVVASGTEDTTNLIAADNTEGFSNDTKSEKDISNTTTTTGSGTDTTSGNYKNTDTLTEDISDTETKELESTDSRTTNISRNDSGTQSGRSETSGTDSWTERRQGNIGVTMTQQLLEAEKQLWSAYDVESQIITEFKQEFLIGVY